MNSTYGSLAIELIVGFFALLLLTKILGKNQLSQLSPFDFVSALVVGELVGNAIYDADVGLMRVLVAISIWGTLIYLIELLTQKIRRSRSLLEGSPSIIIYKGQVNFEELKKNKLDLNQLQHLIRDKGTFSLKEIEHGILETDGKITIIKKHAYDTPTNQELNVKPSARPLPLLLILDGEISSNNIQLANLTNKWLYDEITRQGIPDPKNILYAEWIDGEALHIQTYSMSVESK
ncbi:DUF421 domain-containing protein [Alkalicoccobacillus murimartini]|uniref:Uncharacterized membrane protein YcaP (DUF421 family) n=1 Tax=Alkalicoccobacillus murimartini TaxID=171685 RepID=A0ABT9YDB9_9BACI|nr:DUF421 domain-containing protein [Alkalicoccobacillus murimartini]MDQ0205851.1 uncharacterized membrane protein YcaP (DUF421 family) [Alkalicoccobacillus murimartini]